MAKIIDGPPKGWPDLFKANSLHVVCVATGGLTTCDFVASTIGGMKQEAEVWPLTKHVNRVGETGTFWPRFPLTVIPQAKWEHRNDTHDLETFYRRSFDDVAKANREHIRLSEMFVELSGCERGIDVNTARRIAEDTLSKEPSIKTIYFATEPT